MSKETRPDDESGSDDKDVRALSVNRFLKRYDIKRDLFYSEVKAGRIKLRKAGQRSLVGVEDAETWFANLPTVQPKSAA